MQEIEKKDNNTTMMALASLMFFSPFVHYLLHKGSFTLDDQERNFVRGYIKLGYINLILLVFTLASGIGNYFINNYILQVAYVICIGLVLIVLLVGTICILSNVSLNIQKNFSITFYEVGDKKTLLLKFLPLYNVYIWYKLHNFGTPNRWIKESLLWRTFFVFLALTGHPLILSVVIVLWILRIATLMAGIDVLHIQAKSGINNLFTKNPEEIRGYFTGTLVFLVKGLGRLFNKTPLSLQACVDQEKQQYSRLYNIRTSWEIWIEYLIAAGIIRTYRYLFRPDISTRYVYLPLALIIGRYLIMIVLRWHLPHIPVAREIRTIISAPFHFLFRRRSTHVQA